MVRGHSVCVCAYVQGLSVFYNQATSLDFEACIIFQPLPVAAALAQAAPAVLTWLSTLRLPHRPSLPGTLPGGSFPHPGHEFRGCWDGREGETFGDHEASQLQCLSQDPDRPESAWGPSSAFSPWIWLTHQGFLFRVFLLRISFIPASAAFPGHGGPGSLWSQEEMKTSGWVGQKPLPMLPSPPHHPGRKSGPKEDKACVRAHD